MKRFLIVGIAVASVVLLAAACGGGSSDDTAAADTEQPAASATTEPVDTGAAAGGGEATGEPIVIGFVGAETGFMSIYDSQVFAGAQVAADELNEAGGAAGRPIEFITCDSKTDQAQASVCAEEVLGKGAEIVMPSCDFDFGSPAARVANDAGAVAIGCAGGLKYGVAGVGPLVFNTYSGSATEGSIMAEWAFNDQGWRSPYILTDTFLEYTKDVAEYFEKRWTELAGADSIVGKDTFDNADETISAQISRLRSQASDADFIVLASLPPGGGSAVRQIRAAGIDLPIFGAAAFDGSYWLEAVPNLSDFYYPAIGSLYGDDPDSKHTEILAAVGEKLGADPTLANYPLLGYAAIQTLAVGIEQAGTTEGQPLADAINTFEDQDLVTGPTTYTPDCHIPSGRPYLIMQIQDGVPSYTGTTVTPESVPEHPC
jgi:branched-chain amino acid transport system substrate-binding protein